MMETMMRRIGLVTALVLLSPAFAQEAHQPLPQAASPTAADTPQEAVFAGGCFWGIHGVFQHVKGVTKVVSGYSGGTSRSASYEQVSWGNTGHAEAVRISYDPKQIRYGQLLQVFFSVIDPTTKDYQGPDEGSQYRSEVFAANAEQSLAAKAYIAQLAAAGAFRRPIVTLVSDLKGFYPAEAYHQDYLLRHPSDRYIVVNDLPKIEALKRFYPDLYRENPVTLASR